MTKEDMLELCLQLNKEDKELICVTDTHILVKWVPVCSYVSWHYAYSVTDRMYVFDIGKYMPVSSITIEEAIAAFSERINND